jgi:gliding motility-associated-like protein
MIILSLHLAVLHGQTDTICFNDTILYEVPASVNSGYTWNISGGTIIYSSENMDSVIVVWNESEGLHSVEVTKQSDTYCTGDPEILEVFVYKPSINLGQDLKICKGNTEKIVIDTGYDKYLWNNEPGTNEFIASSGGIVTLEVKDKYGCWSKDNITVTEDKNPAPVADFTINPIDAGIYEELFFYNNSSNATKYLWNFGDGESSELYQPNHSYSTTGNYDVSLWVWSESGCSDSLIVPNAVAITDDCRMIFPNGFMPDKNGPSGGYYNPVQREDNNTIFHPLHRNVDKYELKIYNRWGELIFISRDINIGWDGYYKGKLAPQDTYLYTVRSKCISGKIISTTGSVTLIY